MAYAYNNLLADFFNPDVAELYDGELVVELEADGSRLRPLRIPGVLGDDPAVDGHGDLVVPRDDVHGVPVVVVLAVLGGVHEAVDAAGRVRVGVAVVDLDLVPN